jgi:hypothetical protein
MDRYCESKYSLQTRQKVHICNQCRSIEREKLHNYQRLTKFLLFFKLFLTRHLSQETSVQREKEKLNELLILDKGRMLWRDTKFKTNKDGKKNTKLELWGVERKNRILIRNIYI